MSRRKQQHPLQIIDNDKQELDCNINIVFGANNNQLFTTSEMSITEDENKNNISDQCEQMNCFYGLEDSTMTSEDQDIKINGFNQDLLSDGEFDSIEESPTQNQSGMNNNDLYDLFSSFPKKRRKYIRGGEKVCMICGKITKSPSDLERHMRVHTGERPFHCIISHKPFKCKRSQQSHQYLCHDIADGLSQPRIALLNLHKKHRTDIFNNLNNQFVQDELDINESHNYDSLLLQNSMSQIEELLNKECQNDVETNCSILQSNTSQHSNLLDNHHVSVSKEQSINSTAQGLNEENLSLKKTCIWNNSDFANEKEPGERSYLCELCGQDFGSFIRFHNHHQVVHADIFNNIKEKYIENHIEQPSSNLTQVNSFDISSSSSFIKDLSSGSKTLQEHEQVNTEQKLNVNNDEKIPTNLLPTIDNSDNQNDNCTIEQNDPLSSSSNIINNNQNTSYSSNIGNQTFFPSTYLLTTSGTNKNDSPFAWHSIRIHSEKVLITKLEGVHSTTEQHYVLYKCCLCGNSYPGLGMLCSHLSAHGRNNKEYNCEKCGAVFKWRSQLEVHDQVHRVIDGKLAMSSSVPSNYIFLNSLNNIGLNVANSVSSVMETSTQQTVSQTSAVISSNISSLSSNSMLESITDNNKFNSLVSNDILTANKFNRRRRNNKNVDSFQCKFCSKSFDRIFSLQRHERIHTGIKPCFCKICGRGFSERRNLRHHIIRFHSDNNQKDLLRRNKRQGRPRTINSSLRLVSFLKRTAVRILNSIDQSKFDAPIPDRNSNLPDLINHQINDKCSYSKIAFKNNMETEIKESSQDNCLVDNEKVTVVFPTDVRDAICGSFENTLLQKFQPIDKSREVLQDPKRSLIGSRRKGKPYKFNPMHGNLSDDTEVKLFPQLSVSVSNNNNKDDGLISADSNDSTLQDFNLNSFNGENSFYEPDSLPDLEKTSDSSPESLPSFKAKLRGHGAFFSSYNPRLGVINKPVLRTEACKPRIGPDGQYIYPCGYCLKTFCSTSDLNRHMDFHEDIRPFKCSYCDYYSRTNSQLKVHMMRHQGIKQFLCKVCNYNGVTQSDLNRHCKTRTHLLRARNVCMWCKLGFYTRTLLDEHVRIFHQNEEMTKEQILPVKQENEGSQISESIAQNGKLLSNENSFLPHALVASRNQVDAFENNNFLTNGKNLSLKANEQSIPGIICSETQ